MKKTNTTKGKVDIMKKTLILVGMLLLIGNYAIAKPLKVYILVGQSNMEGHAQTRTFPAIAKDLKTADLYKDMVDAEGKPVICEDVWIAYSYGDFSGNAVGKRSGKLTAGYGSQHHIGTGKIGPEFTFGIYMNKTLNEPVLLIKTAWGGKSLYVDFRPPSASALPDAVKERRVKDAGVNYKLMIDYVKEVLTDPKSVCPAYDDKEGYELAGFVWFQGFNDMVAEPYPRADPSNKRNRTKNYSEYSTLLSCLIRDVRKDLNAPRMPFIIGVLGTGGPSTSESGIAFRKSMAAPAATKEFKGNVVNVFAEKYWPADVAAVLAKEAPFKNEIRKMEKELKAQKPSNADWRAGREKIKADIRVKIEKVMTEDELFLLDKGVSNQGFHYYGSAKFEGQIGKAFAEALLKLDQQTK